MNLCKKIATITLLCTLSATLHAAEYWNNRQEEFQVIEKARLEEVRYGAALQTMLETKFSEKRWLETQSREKQKKFANYIKYYERLAKAAEAKDPSSESEESNTVSALQFGQQVHERSATLYTMFNITSSSMHHQSCQYRGIRRQEWTRIHARIARRRSHYLELEAPNY